MRYRVVLLILYTYIASIGISFCAQAKELSQDVVEQKVQKLARELYCIVCHGQTIAESDAFFAQDVRHMLYHKFTLQESEENIIAYLTERYGEAIYAFPSKENYNKLLWYSPFLLLFLGVGGIIKYYSIVQRKK